MKSYFKIFMLLISFLMLQVLAFCADNKSKGTYVPNIVLTAPWGEKNLSDNNEPSKAGTFGLSKNDQGIALGPTCFRVAPNGNIYIADIINNRVQCFSSSGSFLAVIPNIRVGYDVGMCVDQEGNIYTGNFRIANPYLKKFDQDGNLIRTYMIVKDEEMGTDKPIHWGAQGNILVDDSGRVYVQYIMRGSEYCFQVGTKDAPLSTGQQKASWKEGFYGITSNIPNGNKSFKGNALGADEEANYEIAKDENNEHISVITKYDLEWRLLGTYTLDWSKIDCPLLTSFSMSGRQVFAKGNIYVLCSDKEGIRIIKWSPVEGGK